MALSVKNWKRFQHYKTRRPPWIKFYRELLDDPEWHALSGDASKALAGCWLIASENGGDLPPLPKLAFRLRIPLETLAKIIPELSHWLNGDCKHDASTMLAGRLHDATPETETEREKEGKNLSKDLEGTKSNHCAVASATRTNGSKFFDEFWHAYPRRDGANPKEQARKLFTAALKAGAEAGEITAGAREYASRDRDKIGTPYIAQAATWLRQQRWKDYQRSTAPAADADVEFIEFHRQLRQQEGR